MEVAHDLYNARRYPLPCLRAQNLTTNHRNGHRLAGCQVPRLVPSWSEIGCWEHRQPGRHLRPSFEALDNFAFFFFIFNGFHVSVYSTETPTEPCVQRTYKQRILNSNFGESRAVESIRANLLLSRFRYHRLLRVSPPRWLGRYLRYQRWYMYGLNRPRHAQSQGVSNSPLYATQSEKKHAHGCA